MTDRPVDPSGPDDGLGPEPAPELDPVSPALDADALTDLLRSVGLSDDQIAEAGRHRHLELLAVEHLVLPDEALHDIDDIVEATGLSSDQVTRLWRSLGFAEPQPGDHLFTDIDVEMLRTIGQLVATGWIDDELTLQMARVIGSSLSRVATTLIDTIDPDDPDIQPMQGQGFAAVAPVLMPTLLQIMDYVWRRHVQAEARARMAREHAGVDPAHRVVGFADLVGFTALSQQIDAHELAAVVDRFETIAYDTVQRLGGRVVKMIGDEVMFSVPNEADAVEVALSLSETYREDDGLSDVRVGLAAGPVLQREADLFGPVVNRASRLVNIAFPGSVVCSQEVVDSLAGIEDYVWKSIGTRKLKDLGRVPLSVVRRAESELPPKSKRQKAEAHRAERREAKVAELDESRRERRSRRPSSRDRSDPELPADHGAGADGRDRS